MCPYKILTVASIPIVCITFSENLTQVLLIVNPTIETLLFAECRNHKNTCKLACFMYRCRSEKYIRIRTVLRIINITASTFQHSIGKSQIFSSPSNDQQKTKGRSQTNFLLMRNICNEAGVCVTRTMTGGRCGVLQCRTVCWHDLHFHFHWFNPKEKEEF